MTISEKLNWLLTEYPSLLKSLNPDPGQRKWGKMNLQQMIQHMVDSVREANGKLPRKLMTAEERVPAMKDFLMSEKEFRPETKNALLGDEPSPVRHADVASAIAELESELKDFKNHYTSDPDSVITNPFFGHLNFEEWTQLLYKHAVHHLKQFSGI